MHDQLQRRVCRRVLIGCVGLFLVLGCLRNGPAQAAVLAQWNFNTTGDTNHPTPSVGVGFATVLGGLSAQFSSGTASSDPAGTNDLALALAHFPPQGHSGKTAGVQFNVSTAGYRLTSLRFDLRATATASRAGVILVATDGVTFQEVLPFYVATESVFTNGITIPFEFFMGAADNPKFSVRIVSDYASGTNYAAVKSGSSYSTSGTWRLDMVTFNAEPITPPPEPPRITASPRPLDLEAGLMADFSVTATGVGQLMFQWLHNDVTLPGETNSTLTLPGVEFSEAGLYRVRVSGSAGSVLSDPVMLSVRTPVAPLLETWSWIERPQVPADVGTNQFWEQAVRPGEALHLVATARDPAGRAMVWSREHTAPDPEVQWMVAESRPGFTRAELIWSPSESDAGRISSFRMAATVALRNSGLPGGILPASTGDWSAYVPQALERQMVLSEWLSSPALSPWDNPLNRESTSSNPAQDDQFLEWVNWGSAPLDLSGWLLNTPEGTRHRFGAGETMGPTNAVVIYGALNDGGAPRLAVMAHPASEAGGLADAFRGGSYLEVRNGRSNLVQRLRLDPEAATEGVSFHWEPGVESKFVPHPPLASRWSSAGLRTDGALWILVPVDPEPPVVESRAALGAERQIEIRWASKPGKRYVVERSTTPGGPFAPVTAPTDSGFFSESMGPAGLNFFYRVRLP